MDLSSDLFLSQFQQIHGRRLPIPTLLNQISDQMDERSKADKVRKIVLATPLKRVANFIDHYTGTDATHRERWANSHGAHVVERCSDPTSIHNTALYDHMRQKRRMHYEECFNSEGAEKFWAVDQRPTWRTIRMPDYSKAEPLFSIYRSTATYVATITKNTRVATKYYLVCDDIVNFLVLREMSQSTPTELRSRMWRLWSMGHNFNIPVELELPLIRNCVDVAVLLCMAYASEELMDNREVVVVDATLNDISLLGPHEVYTPKFRHMEEYDSNVEPMLRHADNRRKPRLEAEQFNTLEEARTALLKNDFVQRVANSMSEVEVSLTLEDDDDYVDITDDLCVKSGQSKVAVDVDPKPTDDAVVSDTANDDIQERPKDKSRTVVSDTANDDINDNQKRPKKDKSKRHKTRGKSHRVVVQHPLVVEGTVTVDATGNNSNNEKSSRFAPRPTSSGRRD